MTFGVYSIKDEDEIYGAPFTQATDGLAAQAVVNYCKKMPFMKVKLCKIGYFDTKLGLTGIQPIEDQELNYKKIFADYMVELAEYEKDGFELSKEDIPD